MNIMARSSKKRFPCSLLIAMGMMTLTPAIVSAAQSHEQVKNDMAKESQITIEQAIQTATKEVPGTVIKAELEKEHGPLMWEIEIVTAQGTIQEVHLDGTSGKHLALEQAEHSGDSDTAIHTGSAESGKPQLK